MQDLQILFDFEFYRGSARGGPEENLDEPDQWIEHYLAEGDTQGASPHPLFDPSYYGSQHPDLPPEGGARFRHFIENGGHDGSSPHPLFQSDFYLSQCPELRGSAENLLVHYLEQGEERGKKPNPLFDPNYYVEQNTDLALQLLGTHGKVGQRDPRIEPWTNQLELTLAIGRRRFPQSLTSSHILSNSFTSSEGTE